MKIGTRLTVFCATMSLMSGLAYGQGQSAQQGQSSQEGQSSQQGQSASQQGQQSSSGGQQQAPVQFNKSSTLGGEKGLAMDPGQKQVMFIASELIGKNASSPQGQNLGKLAEIVFGPQQGAFAVLDLPNNRQTAVPWQLVTAVTRENIVINTTQAALSQAPTLQADKNYANFNSPQFTQQLFTYFKVEQQGMGSGGQSQSGQGQSSQQQSSPSSPSSGQSGQSDQSQSQPQE